jgi:thiol-disulfide isomerase/thioredoxin
MSKILFFSAPWCGPCRQMKTMLNDSIKESLNIEIIDITLDTDMSIKHQIMNVPTFVKIENNKEVARKMGSQTIESLKKL